jgi:hypothetical protein
MTTTISYTYETYNHEGELLDNGYVHVQTNNFYPLEWWTENTNIQLKYEVGVYGLDWLINCAKQLGICPNDSSDVTRWFSSVDGEICFNNGDLTNYSMHIKTSDPKKFKSIFNRINQLLGS